MKVARVFRRAAVTAAVALAAPLTWLAEPAAAACSCSKLYDIPAEMLRGHVFAVVTQTSADTSAPELRVERTFGPTHTQTAKGFKPITKPGPPFPSTLNGEAARYGCAPYPFQGVTAVSAYPLEGTWFARNCREMDLGTVLQHMSGDAPTTSTAKPVAVLAGKFGNSSLAAVDERGEVVAWDRRSGGVDRVVACPGARTVLAYGYEYSDDKLVARDARTLAELQTFSLPANLTGLDGLRCADSDGRGAQIYVGDTVWTLTQTSIAGERVSTRPSWAAPVKPVPGTATVGGTTFDFGQTRLTLTAARGQPQVVDNLWLAATTDVASLLDVEGDRGSLSTDDQLPVVLSGVGLVVLGLGIAGRRGGRE